jgi:hypothetical protein
MSYELKYNQSINIICVIYSGIVSLKERKAAVNEVCAKTFDQKELKILVNVCDLTMNLSIKEQSHFGEYLASHPGLSHAKVAVLHKPGYNPNLLIDTCAFNNGYRLAEFIKLEEANTWLIEP